MLPSQTLVSSNSIPLCRQHSAKTLQRSSSSLSVLSSPAALRRCDSGPVQAAGLAGPILLQLASDQPAECRANQAVAVNLEQKPVCQLATTMSPTKPRSAQEFQANFGTAIRYCCHTRTEAHLDNFSSLGWCWHALVDAVDLKCWCRTLREDIPCTLQRSPNMDIFADNIAFTDNISPRMGHQTNLIQGHEAYSRQLWSLRFHAALLFSRSHVSTVYCLYYAYILACHKASHLPCTQDCY